MASLYRQFHMKKDPSEKPEQITDSLGKKYILLPKEPLAEGFEGPSGFLGKGAFGAVSIAFDSQFQSFAVKEIKKNKSDPDIDGVLSECTKEIAYMHHLGIQAEMIHVHSDDPKRARPITPSGSPKERNNNIKQPKAGSKEEIKSSREKTKKNSKFL